VGVLCLSYCEFFSDMNSSSNNFYSWVLSPADDFETLTQEIFHGPNHNLFIRLDFLVCDAVLSDRGGARYVGELDRVSRCHAEGNPLCYLLIKM